MSQLDEYRAQLDAIDGGLTELFLRRMEVTARVGEYKKAAGIPVLDAQREQQVIAARSALAQTPADRHAVANLFESIMTLSRHQQRRIVKEGAEDLGYARWLRQRATQREPVAHPRVAFQGERGCYSEEAAAGFFSEDCDLRGLPWFSDVFEALREGKCDYAMLPVENSSTGSIRQVYDLLSENDCFLVGEWQVKVEHCLAALPGVGLEDIETVYSHEQGLMQCDKFLDGRPAWRRVPTLDTAGSARQVHDTGDRTAAAICSKRAAKLYGLQVLAEGINYNDANVTRFVAVSPAPEFREGRDKVSAVFSLPHQSGSLHEILTIFAVQGLNLLKLESRPILGRGWEYLFFVDFAGDLTAPGMDGVIHELSQLSADLRILGNFKGYGE